MAEGCDFFVNELLCYTNSYYGKVPKSELIGILTGFYDDDEVSLAKDVLFNTVDNISPKIDGLPRLRIRKDSVNKRRLDCEDSVNLVEFLDKKNIQPPVFHAVKVNRLPRISPSDIDCVRIAETIAVLKEQVNEMASQLAELKHSLVDTVSSGTPLAKEATVHGTGNVETDVSAVSNEPVLSLIHI